MGGVHEYVLLYPVLLYCHTSWVGWWWIGWWVGWGRWARGEVSWWFGGWVGGLRVDIIVLARSPTILFYFAPMEASINFHGRK